MMVSRKPTCHSYLIMLLSFILNPVITVTVLSTETEVRESTNYVWVCVMITNGKVEDGSSYVRYSLYSGSATGMINYVWLWNDEYFI